jgi:hypothetical protein
VAAEAVAGRPLHVKIVSLDHLRGNGDQAENVSIKTSRSSPVNQALQQQKRDVIQSVVDIFEGTIIT